MIDPNYGVCDRWSKQPAVPANGDRVSRRLPCGCYAYGFGKSPREARNQMLKAFEIGCPQDGKHERIEEPIQ